MFGNGKCKTIRCNLLQLRQLDRSNLRLPGFTLTAHSVLEFILNILLLGHGSMRLACAIEVSSFYSLLIAAFATL